MAVNPTIELIACVLMHSKNNAIILCYAQIGSIRPKF